MTACSTASAASRPVAGSADVGALLASRARAVLAHDGPALGRTSAATATGGVRDLVRRTVALPLTRWTYTVESVAPGPGTGEQFVVATLRYRLTVDRSDVTAQRRLLLVDAGGSAAGWRVRSDDPVGAALPWDLGTLTYAGGTYGAAMTTTAQPPAALAAAADRAEEAVTGVWGPGWSRHPVVVAVAGPADLAQLTGRTAAQVDGLVAVSTLDRVYVDLAAYAGLSVAGRQVLVTHEVTHLATGAAAGHSVPQWLKEGFADYVGFLGSGISTSAAAATLLARVRGSGAPTALPPDPAFDPVATSSSAAGSTGWSEADAYAAAWLACSAVAGDVGSAGLARVYRTTAAGRGDATSDVDAALRQVTSESLAQWTQRWRADLVHLAATTGSGQ